MQPNNQLNNHNIVQTEDGSVTLWSKKFDEHCHSLVGAKSETVFNYLEGCNIPAKIQNKELINILEVGFGAGIGLQTTFELMTKQSWPTKLFFCSLELDKELIEWSKQNSCPFLKDGNYHKKDELEYFEIHNDKFHILILLGDARNTLPKAKQLDLLPLFNAVYQDAFSPKTNPELWTTEWFSQVKNCCSKDAILSTYSSATITKDSLTEAGWSFEKVKGFGKKRFSLRAIQL